MMDLSMVGLRDVMAGAMMRTGRMGGSRDMQRKEGAGALNCFLS